MHGYLADSNSFIYQKQFFSRYFKIYCPDFKGFGTNKNMEYPYSLDDYCKEIIEYIKQNNLVKPNVIAHSFGGRVALKLAYQNPDLFDKIVLTGCAGLKPKRSIKYRIKKCIFKTIKPIASERIKLRFYSKDYLALNSTMRLSFNKIINEHLDYTLQYIKNKTLIIFGENDKETPLYMAYKLNKNIKNCMLIIIKGAGHFAFIDKPLKFNTEVREFLLSH